MLYGNLISLPVGDGMLYVEPVYVKGGQENAVPLLQKVLMSYGDGGTYVVLADNLQQGLDQLVAQGKADRTQHRRTQRSRDHAAGAGTAQLPASWRRPRHGRRRRSQREGGAESGDFGSTARR